MLMAMAVRCKIHGSNTSILRLYPSLDIDVCQCFFCICVVWAEALLWADPTVQQVLSIVYVILNFRS
jgi:hypothetical protein